MDSGTGIGYQDIIFHPAIYAFMVAEHGAHEVFDQGPVPRYTHQLFDEMSTPGIWNANVGSLTPTAAEAFPFAGGNGDGSGGRQIFDPRSTSATHQYDLHGNENASLCTQSGSPSPFWIPSAINAQSEWCSERHTQQVFNAMSTLQGRVLSVRILHAVYPVTLDMLNHVFSLYGSVEKIVHACPLTGHQVLIQYQQHQMASLALRTLQGHSLYQSCCYLEVKYALGSELQVLYPSSSVGNMFAGGNTYKEHDDFALSNERVIEQPPPMHVLDEVPSAYDPKVAVQLCSSEVVQAAAMVRQGNPASSPPLVVHVDGMEMPMSVQDASDLFEEMPVYDVYEEDTNASPHGVVELSDTVGRHRQYDSEKPGATKLSSWECDNEVLAVCFNNASNNAFSERATDLTCPQAHVIQADRFIKLTNEKSNQATYTLCLHEVIVHCHEERTEHINCTNDLETVQLNFEQEDILISGAVSNVVNSTAWEFVAAPSHCINRAELRLLWDPGASLPHISIKKQQPDKALRPAIHASTLVDNFEKLHGHENVALIAGSSVTGFSGYKCLSLWTQNNIYVCWKSEIGLTTYISCYPGVLSIIDDMMLDKYSVSHQVQLVQLKTECFFLSSTACIQYIAANGINTVLHATCFRLRRTAHLTQELSAWPNQSVHISASLPCVQQETMHFNDARSGINRKKQYVLITMHAITYPYDLNNDKEVRFTLQYQLPLNSTPCIWDPGIDLFSHKKLHIFSWIPYSAIIIPQQEHFFFAEKGTQVPWDPGIELLLYEILWLKTVSKETESALRHLSEMLCTISEQWSFKYNAMHYCEIFQRCTTMSSLFHCQGIPFWLIHFQPP